MAELNHTKSWSRADAARQNRATSASFTEQDMDNPIAEGSFRKVAKGEFTEGEHKGDPCVCKWPKSGKTYSECAYGEDMSVLEKAKEYVYDFNKREFCDRIIRINMPEVWSFTDNLSAQPGTDGGGMKVLVEPFLPQFKKYNSNTGWMRKGEGWNEVMQALSHFSFHVSGGEVLLVDLQGGLFEDEMILTDPAIVSMEGDYGETDLGPEGMEAFFGTHKCTKFCEKDWLKMDSVAPLDGLGEWSGSAGASSGSNLLVRQGTTRRSSLGTSISRQKSGPAPGFGPGHHD